VSIPSRNMTNLYVSINSGSASDTEYYATRIAHENLGPYREQLFEGYQNALREIYLLTETLKVVSAEATNRRKYYEV
jgi:hypothetical protein